jgi:hypothetical protein
MALEQSQSTKDESSPQESFSSETNSGSIVIDPKVSSQENEKLIEKVKIGTTDASRPTTIVTAKTRSTKSSNDSTVGTGSVEIKSGSDAESPIKNKLFENFDKSSSEGDLGRIFKGNLQSTRVATEKNSTGSNVFERPNTPTKVLAPVLTEISPKIPEPPPTFQHKHRWKVMIGLLLTVLILSPLLYR